MADDLQKITYFAKTNSRGKEVPFGIKRIDRCRHMYVIGKTGMGKSTLLENLAIQDIRNGEGLAFIDPHGGTADKLLEYVPEHRIKDVIYFTPFDTDFPVAFNVMEDVGYDKRHLVVSGLMAAFKKIWVDAWSARMEYILQNVLFALLEYEGSTLLDVNTMLINKEFRAKVVANIQDPTIKKFWSEEFAGYSDRYTQDATPAIQNKIGQFANNPLIRNIIGQPKSSFDFRKAMDEKKIIIINLSKGRVGEVNGALLGSMLVTKIYLSAMSRADVSATEMKKLPDFYFYVDEFQNFANKSFIDILSEARKYKLNLIIAHQFIEQVEEEIRNAVFGNVGTTVAFRVGPFDAQVLETLFQPQFMAPDLVNLGFAQVYLTLMIDGVGSPPFSATTLPPFDPPPKIFVDDVIASSRAQFAKPRAEVEQALAEWQAGVATVATTVPRAVITPTPASVTVSTRPVFVSPRPFAPRPRTAYTPVVTGVVANTAVTQSNVSIQQKVANPVSTAVTTPNSAVHTPAPLEGSSSLREALLNVDGLSIASQSLPTQPRDTSSSTPAVTNTSAPVEKKSSDLGGFLRTIAPDAIAEKVITNVTPKPKSIPEEKLRAMLHVDPIHNTKENN